MTHPKDVPIGEQNFTSSVLKAGYYSLYHTSEIEDDNLIL